MAYPPFMNSTGLVSKIFEKVAEAAVPPRFTQDYLGSVLGYASGSAKPFIPLLKRLGFLNSDGSPTALYSRFRVPSDRASAMLEALKMGYPAFYSRNEYAHHLPKEKLRDMALEITGLERDNTIVSAIVGTFEALKKVGGIDATTKVAPAAPPPAKHVPVPDETPPALGPKRNGEEVGLNLAYTINLNLPASSDPEVFNAIFKALKEHLLGK